MEHRRQLLSKTYANKTPPQIKLKLIFFSAERDRARVRSEFPGAIPRVARRNAAGQRRAQTQRGRSHF